MSTTKITITNKTNVKPVNVVLFQKNGTNASSAIVWQVVENLAVSKSQTVDYDNYPLLAVVSPSGAKFPVRLIADGGRFEINNENDKILLTEVSGNTLPTSSKTQVVNNLKQGSTSASILVGKFPIMTKKIIAPLQGVTFQRDMYLYAFIDTTKKLKQGDVISFEQIRSAQFYPMIDTIEVTIDV